MSAKPEKCLKALLGERRGKLVLAESCTGGLVAARVTSVPGSSDYFDRGFVVYTDEAKTEMLGVPSEIIRKHGAVSRETALALIAGIFDRTGATLAGAVTGIAGPGGERPGKPVGTVWIAWGTREKIQAEDLKLYGKSRYQVRRLTAAALLERLCEAAAG